MLIPSVPWLQQLKTRSPRVLPFHALQSAACHSDRTRRRADSAECQSHEFPKTHAMPLKQVQTGERKTVPHQGQPLSATSQQCHFFFFSDYLFIWASLVAQQQRIHQPMQKTMVWSLGWEDPLEKEMAARSSTLAWEIPWTEGPGGLQSIGSQRVGCDLATKQQQKSTYLFVLVLPQDMWESQLPNQESNPCPLHYKLRVLPTGTAREVPYDATSNL